MFDAEFNTGTKSLGNTGMKRLKAFADWACHRPEDVVVAVGHSLFFRSFFRVSDEKKHAFFVLRDYDLVFPHVGFTLPREETSKVVLTGVSLRCWVIHSLLPIPPIDLEGLPDADVLCFVVLD